MKKIFYCLFAAMLAVGLNSCEPERNEPGAPQGNEQTTPSDSIPAPETEVPGDTIPEVPGDTVPIVPEDTVPTMPESSGKTLIVYYSFTNNIHTIAQELHAQIEGSDILRIEPAEEGLDYAANNYAIGSALIAAIRNNPNDVSSYPEIKPVSVELADYERVIVGAPLWWSQMAAPMQTFLFHYGSQLAGKEIGLVVSSASSGISGVESDAHRLIPEGNFLSPTLWIRSSQTSNCASLIAAWLEEIE